jgi:UDP-N-acetylglucosamine--N-acetylmuramyl-(pentapeptide) pyrophosphoryl-undecaprenol N-acetylglucosamine transferase
VNAQPLVDVGAGIVVRDEDLTADVVAGLVGDLIVDSTRLATMSAAAESLGARDADERLTDMVLAAAGRS